MSVVRPEHEVHFKNEHVKKAEKKKVYGLIHGTHDKKI